MSNVIEVPVLPDKPGRPPLKAVIDAQLQSERWQRRTAQWHKVLAAVSVAMAYRLFAGLEGRTLGVTLVLSAWLATFVTLFVCAEAGWRSGRRLDRMVSAIGTRRRAPSDDA